VKVPFKIGVLDRVLKNVGRIARIWHKKLKKFSTRTELVNPPTSSLVILKMSTPVVSSAKSSASKVASAPKVVKEKKPRTPTLPAKFGKFIQFGYWFMKRINSLDENVPAVDEDLCVEQLNLFGDVESQQAFVQSFFDDSKDIAKTLRGIIQQKKKDEVKAAKLAAKEQAKSEKASTKEKKPRAPRQKKEKTDDDAAVDVADADADKKKPRGRKPKAKVLSSEDAFVNEMVQLANGETDTIPTPVPSPAKDTKTKEVKTKEPKEVKVKEVKTKEPKEVKTKEVKTKEPKEVKVKTKTKDSKTNPSQNDEQTSVSVLNLHNKQYLIDDLNLVYDFHSHELIGTFNPNTLTISESK